MGVFEIIEKRKSIRGYRADPVSEESLGKILEAGRLAPSAHNHQNWKFIVIKGSEKKKKLAEVAQHGKFLAEAPIVIVAVALKPEDVLSSGVPNYAVDLTIAVDHMILVATEERLGTCWLGAFSQEEAKKILKIPNKYKIVTMFPLGYSADSGRPKERKNLEEITCQEEFKE